MAKSIIALTVNGDPHELAVSPRQTLQDVIRDDLGLIGTKKGCTSGSCGVCTIINDEGEAILSCLTLAIEWDGCSLTTIEGIEIDGTLHPVQKAFIEYGAVQCGFCTPGLLMTAKALVDSNPDPDDEAINEALAGVICRCTGHIKVKHAIRNVSQFTSKSGKDD
ncbi:MAG: (2Fe-2S)-binding protein [Alphaproteobacteria bacterium]|nr:MAG: (2Fe-2S)-binding protein [Alphaproteobacteria bacterium]